MGIARLARRTALVKTEGYHERRVSLSRVVQRKLSGAMAADLSADIARSRVQLTGEMGGTLRFALMSLFENGPDKVDGKNNAAGRKAEPFKARFERAVDTDFDALWREVEHDDQTARHAERSA